MLRKISFRRVPARLLGMLLVVGAVITMGAAPAAAQAQLCDYYALFNRSANKFVSAEFGRSGWEYGLLRARADAVGPWEEFYICQRTNGEWDYINSATDFNYGVLSVDLSLPGQFDGAVIANSSALDGIQYREQFGIISVGGGYYSFRSRTANRYLIAETGYAGQYDGMLRAAATTNSSYRTHFRIVLSPR